MSSLIVNPVPLPYGDPIAEPRKLFEGKTLAELITWVRGQGRKVYITDPWSQALDTQAQQLASSPAVINRIRESDLSASVASSDLAGATLAGGLYEVKANARIITAAGVSSSVTVTIGWTQGGVIQSESFAAIAGNTTTSGLTGPPKTFRADASTPITYAVTYASNPAGAAHYSLDLILSRLAS